MVLILVSSALEISAFALVVATVFDRLIWGRSASPTPTNLSSYFGGFKYQSGTSLSDATFVPAQPARITNPNIITKILLFIVFPYSISAKHG